MSDNMSDVWFTEVYLPQQLELKLELPDNFPVTTWDFVREDITNREEMGALKYGKYLTPNTNEDMLQHAYEEALDLVVYLKTLILQRNKNASDTP